MLKKKNRKCNKQKRKTINFALNFTQLIAHSQDIVNHLASYNAETSISSSEIPANVYYLPSFTWLVFFFSIVSFDTLSFIPFVLNKFLHNL